LSHTADQQNLFSALAKPTGHIKRSCVDYPNIFDLCSSGILLLKFLTNTGAALSCAKGSELSHNLTTAFTPKVPSKTARDKSHLHTDQNKERKSSPSFVLGVLFENQAREC